MKRPSTFHPLCSTGKPTARAAALTGLVSVALLCCSCTNARQTAAVDPFLEHSEKLAKARDTEKETQTVAAAPAEPPVDLEELRPERKVVEQTAFTPQILGEARISRPSSRTTALPFPDVDEAAVSFSAADRRIPIGSVVPGEPCQVPFCDVAGGAPSPERHPDEYLFDGGDRGLPVHYSENHRLGLNTEDTIAEWVDHTGDEHVIPSNRVAVYSPRFGAVRSVSLPATSSTVGEPEDVSVRTAGSGLDSRVAMAQHNEQQAVGGVRVRSRASGLEGEAAQQAVDQSARLAQHEKLINTYEDLNFVRAGEFLDSERARLDYGVQAAEIWTKNDFPVIAAVLAGPNEIEILASAGELVGTEQRLSKGQLRIVKLADRKTALPGDIVTFTVRYDNLGDREVHHVRLLDNLTPRLDYVDNSATADRDGQLIVEENGEGSVILRWEFAEPLPGHSGGVVTFQARVR